MLQIEIFDCPLCLADILHYFNNFNALLTLFSGKHSHKVVLWSAKVCKALWFHLLSRLTIVSHEAKKSQRPLSELFTRNTAKKLANALAKPPWQLAPSYYSPNSSYYIELTNQQSWKSAPLFLSTSHCEFNGAPSCAHVRKTIPIPLVPKFHTFIVPSITKESLSPTVKRYRLSSFSSSLSRSHLPGPHVWSARRYFYLSFFVSFFRFSSHTFFTSTKVCVSPRDTNIT